MPFAKKYPLVVVLLILLISTGHGTAQEVTPENTPEATPEMPTGPVPDVVTVEATDGRTLVGDYYTPPGIGYGPVALLLHELYTNSTSWNPLVGPLLANGYRVLAVDLRGYGRTRGTINWHQAQEDTQTWLEWIHTHPGVQRDAIFTVGSSMGSSLALVGCVEAVHCAGVVALSPGRSYFGVYTLDVFAGGIPVLLVYAEDDYYSARGVPQMMETAVEHELDDTLTVQVYSGNGHGIQLFAEDDCLATIITWMNRHR